MLPDGPRSDLVLHIGGPPYSKVNVHAGNSKKSAQANACWATKLLFSPSFWAQTPFGYFFLYFLSFIYLYCLFIFHNFTNQLKLFLNKLKTQKKISLLKLISSIFIFVNKIDLINLV